MFIAFNKVVIFIIFMREICKTFFYKKTWSDNIMDVLNVK